MLRLPPSQLLRLLAAAAVVLLGLLLLVGLLMLTETALSAWQRLRALPLALQLLWALIAAALGLGSLALGLWLLRPRGARTAKPPQRIDRADLEQRLAALDPDSAAAARAELAELDGRCAGALRWVALFGEVSAGKSSLFNALVGQPLADTAPLAGTTRALRHAPLALPGLDGVMLADVPGFDDPSPDGSERTAEAEAEALRAHVVVFVVDADLGRVGGQRLERLLGYGKPLLLVLNKADQYSDAERAALRRRLAQRHPQGEAAIVETRAGGRERIQRIGADGRIDWVEREREPEVEALRVALRRLLETPPEVIEEARQQAVLRALAERIGEAEARQRASAAEAIVQKYSGRAVVGALAAVAPGSDLVIQGALATMMVRELCGVHRAEVRDIDVDRLVELAGRRLRLSASLLLAIAGNALKAFPGLGTVSGGVVHAIAYGLLFGALGRAVAATLAERGALDARAAIDRVDAELAQPLAARALALARLALEQAARAERKDR